VKYHIYTLALGLLLGSASTATAQERKTATKDDAKSETRLRGQLPANYRALGLSEEQRQKIYKLQNEFADKIKELEEQIEKVKADRNKAYVKVLTKAQQDRLLEIQKEKSGDDKSPAK
jgi:hypothetical protein